VRLHRRLDHALGEREKALVEGRFEDLRPLDQVDDLAQLHERVPPLAERVEPFANPALPFRCVGLDVRASERVQVGVGFGELHLAVRETVAVRLRAVTRHRLILDSGARPADGARKPPSRLVPAHRLPEPEALDNLVQLSRQDLSQGLTPGHDPKEAVSLLQVLDGHVVALREAGGRLLPELHRRALDPALAGLRLQP
jgi:hypothetical protein